MPFPSGNRRVTAGVPPSIASRSVCTRGTVASRAGNGPECRVRRVLPSLVVDTEGAMNVDRQMQLLTAGAVDVISEAELRTQARTRAARCG